MGSCSHGQVLTASYSILLWPWPRSNLEFVRVWFYFVLLFLFLFVRDTGIEARVIRVSAILFYFKTKCLRLVLNLQSSFPNLLRFWNYKHAPLDMCAFLLACFIRTGQVEELCLSKIAPHLQSSWKDRHSRVCALRFYCAWPSVSAAKPASTSASLLFNMLSLDHHQQCGEFVRNTDT